MIDVQASGWLVFLLMLIASSAAGLSATLHLPFVTAFRTQRIFIAFGCAIAPFLLGLTGILVLTVLPGAAHFVHLTATLAALAIAGVLLYALRPRTTLAQGAAVPRAWTMPEFALAALIAVWTVVLLADSVLMPLLQSDALQYAISGRRLFQLRDLSAYPSMDPVNDPSGFYGPWTHPPLYAALIYLTQAAQGSAAEPGLMRLIAPWALIASTGLVYALGLLSSRTLGLLAAILYVSTPLLFFGASSALLDALSVAATAIVVACISGMDTSRLRNAFLMGLPVGLVLWAHSQSILLIPLAAFALLCVFGLRDRRRFVAHCALFLLAAVLVGGWPYVSNLLRFGFLISDNPEVFAMPELNWEEYFRVARNFDSLLGRFQYGVLKGWFALEAYSLSFWFLLLGCAVLFRSRKPAGADMDANDGIDGAYRRVLICSLAIVGCYFVGVLLSALAGIDAMIKTERYMLIIMPCVALLAAHGLTRTIAGPPGRTIAGPPASAAQRPGRLPIARAALGGALGVLLLAQLVVLAGYRLRSLDLTLADARLPLSQKLTKWKPWPAIEYLKTRTPADALVLSLQPADMYYSDRKMVGLLDPRLVSVYREREREGVYRGLERLGVSYAYVPDFGVPALYNTSLQDLLADPRYAALVHSHGGYQVYRLRRLEPGASRTPDARLDIGPAVIHWRWERGITFGGRKRLLRLSATEGKLPADGTLGPSGAALLQREYSTRLVSAPLPSACGARPVSAGEAAGRELLAELVLQGRGFAHVFVEHLDGQGRLVEEEALGGMALRPDAAPKTYPKRFRTRAADGALRLVVEFRGGAEVRLSRAYLSVLTP